MNPKPVGSLMLHSTMHKQLNIVHFQTKILKLYSSLVVETSILFCFTSDAGKLYEQFEFSKYDKVRKPFITYNVYIKQSKISKRITQGVKILTVVL